MPAQWYDWTCSCCATEWVERATGHGRGADIYANREQVVYQVGYPDNVNATYGLMDGSGRELQRVLEEHSGLQSAQDWLDFDTVYELAKSTTGMMSGQAYYHWVALRGVRGSNIWISNSAPGYKGIWDELSHSDFERLGGWSVVWLIT